MNYFIAKGMFIGFLASNLTAQDANIIDPQGIRQALVTEKEKVTPADATPKVNETDAGKSKDDSLSTANSDLAIKLAEDRRQASELKEIKNREHLPKRFADDLFGFRENMTDVTEGGIPDDYVLGVGDKLQIMGFGSATFELTSQIDGKGNIVISKVGNIRVAGLTLGKAKALAQSVVSRQLAGTKVDLAVTKLREVRVFLLGEVYRPGSYMVPSLSSLVNVLGMAGGPNGLGSYRQVRVMRGGQVIHEVDLYPLRSEGKGNLNFALQSGDTLFVPLAFNRVTLEGDFVRVARTPFGVKGVPSQANVPTGGAAVAGKDLERNLPSMQFELLPSETVKDALGFAGGLLPEANSWGLTLRRQNEAGVTSGLDIPMNQLDKFQLQNGDVLSALPRRDKARQLVTIGGWARVPGSFARTEGLRLGDLLKRDSQVMPDTYLLRGDIVRTLPDDSTQFIGFNVANALAGVPADDLVLADRDEITLYPLDRMRLSEQVTLSGPFTQAGTYAFHRGMRVADLIFLAGIPKKEASRMGAELAHSRYGNPSEIIKIDISKLISTEDNSPVNLTDDGINPLLKDDDQVTIFEKPQFRIHRTVSIHGQVARPGKYILDSDHPTLSGLIERAGGVTPNAMVNAGMFFRPIGAEGENASEVRFSASSGIGEILDRLNETKLIDPAVSGKTGSQGSILPTVFKVPVLHGLDALKLNRVIVDFPGAIAKKPEADIELNDKDEVVIPRMTDTAMILGEAATPFAFYKVRPGMKVADILQMAGGMTRNADRWNIRLLKADGHIVEHWVSHQAIEPGDAVLIPQVVRRDVAWQENLSAMTPIAILIDALRR